MKNKKENFLDWKFQIIGAFPNKKSSFRWLESVTKLFHGYLQN